MVRITNRNVFNSIHRSSKAIHVARELTFLPLACPVLSLSAKGQRGREEEKNVIDFINFNNISSVFQCRVAMCVWARTVASSERTNERVTTKLHIECNVEKDWLCILIQTIARCVRCMVGIGGLVSYSVCVSFMLPDISSLSLSSSASPHTLVGRVKCELWSMWYDVDRKKRKIKMRHNSRTNCTEHT